MHVPNKQTAFANFKVLGGVPRYVLDACKSQGGIDKCMVVIEKVDA